MTDYRAAAYQIVKADFSVLPCGPDKRPMLKSWKEFQVRQMTLAEIENNFPDAPRIGVICGKVSGNMEVLDFDDPTIYEPFLDLTREQAPDLPSKLLKRQTPSAGYHLIYRSTERVKGNQVFSRDLEGKVRIESRGEGGYVLSAPSPGYEVIEGSLLECQTLTPEEVEILHSTARAFDQRHKEKTAPGKERKKSEGTRPGDRFNEENTVDEVLTKYGWNICRRTTAGMGYTRPGKDQDVSGVVLDGTGNFYCWSSNALPLEPKTSYSAFALYAAYEFGTGHNGLSAAARALAGDKQEHHQHKDSRRQAPAADPEQWPEPAPLVNQQESEPYPLDALPGIIGAAVREVVGFVQCPVALAACSALAVVSTVGQGLVDVRRADGLEGPASVFFVALADSGERKTSVDNHFSGPIIQWERDQAALVKPDMVKYDAEKIAWEAKQSGLMADIKAKTKSGEDTQELEKQLVNLGMNQPERPPVPRLLFGDSTPEALALALADKWPVGAVLVSEAGIVFGGHAMGRDSVMRNLSLLNTLWDGKPLRIDRKGGPSFTVDEARLTMGLAVQPETIKTFLDASKGLARGIGFLARFLIAWPESTQGKRMFKNPPARWPEKERFHRQLSALLSRPLEFDENGNLSPQMLELSPDAKKIWIAFHDDVETELRPGRDMAEARDVASKAADNAARLAALLHVFENRPGGSIRPDHMEAAARIVSWHLYEARRFIGEIALPVEQTTALKLDAWLIEYCRQEKRVEVSTRHLQQMGPYATRKKDDLFPALEELIEAGRVRLQKKMVKINPALLEG